MKIVSVHGENSCGCSSLASNNNSLRVGLYSSTECIFPRLRVEESD